MNTLIEASQAKTAAGRSPSRAWYSLALAIALVGVAAAIAWGVTSVRTINRHVSAFPSGTVPGSVTVSVSRAGEQMVYYQGGHRPEPGALGLTVKGPSGGLVPIKPYALDLRVDVTGGVGKAIATFAAETPGAYSIATTRAAQPGAVILVGDNIGKSLITRTIGAIGLVLASLLVAAAIIVVVLVKRSRPTGAP